jgi:hypothetical protein
LYELFTNSNYHQNAELLWLTPPKTLKPEPKPCVLLLLQVRVMPRCWLVLLRLWLRVDGSLVRLREVRHFCR